MKRYILAILLFTHIALVFMLLGGALLDNFVNFANWFQSVPDSLLVAKAFNSYRHPGYFFIPMLLLVIVSGAVFVAAAWNSHENMARTGVLVGTVLFVVILLLNLGFIYPRLMTVVGEGSEMRALEVLQQASQELQVLIQVRLVIGVIGAAFAVFGLWRFYENAPKSFNAEAEEILSGKTG
jgi:hypothetical protein